MAKPKALDLFCGAGGLTRGLIDAGFRVLGAIDVDDLAVETYRKNFPWIVLWGKDIRKVTAVEVSRRLKLSPGELDLLAGCPPCEGFSAMRTLNGRRTHIRDPRNNLLFEFERFARRLRPKVIMLENVPALAKNWRIKKFARNLRRMGYAVRYDVVDARDFGVPQRRRRMLLLASRLGSPPVCEPAARTATVRIALRGLRAAGRSGDPLHDHGESRDAEVMSLIKRIPGNGGGRLDLPKSGQLACHRRCDGFKDVYGRMAWDDVAPTITSGCVNPSKGRFLHPVRDRSITLREAATLQSFPPNHYISLRRGKFPAAQLIGNALPPELVRRQALAVINHLKAHRSEEPKRQRRPTQVSALSSIAR